MVIKPGVVKLEDPGLGIKMNDGMRSKTNGHGMLNGMDGPENERLNDVEHDDLGGVRSY